MLTKHLAFLDATKHKSTSSLSSSFSDLHSVMPLPVARLTGHPSSIMRHDESIRSVFLGNHFGSVRISTNWCIALEGNQKH